MLQIKESWNKARLAVMLAFITNGLLMATWASRIPAVQEKLALSDGELGIILAGFSAGLLTALLISAGLIARFGSHRIFHLSTLICCLTLPSLMIISHPIFLFVVLFLFGGGISAADMSMNEQAVFVERDANRPMMSSFHGGYSVGGLSGALIGSGMAALPELSPIIHFSMIAIIISCVLVWIIPNFLQNDLKTGKKTGIFRLPQRAVWMLGAIAFCCSIGERTVTDWGAVYLTQVLKTDAAFAVLGFVAFSLTMTIMRLIGDFLSKIMPSALVIQAGGLLASLGILAASVTNNRIVVIVGLAAVGVGVANIIPILFSTAGNIPGLAPESGIAGVATIGYFGFLVSPLLIGFVSEVTSSLRFAFIVSALIVGTILFSAKAISDSRKLE
jgi:MFS family permease